LFVFLFLAAVNPAIGLVKNVMKLTSNHELLAVVVQLHVIKRLLLVLLLKLPQNKVIGHVIPVIISILLLVLHVINVVDKNQDLQIPMFLQQRQHQNQAIGSVHLVLKQILVRVLYVDPVVRLDHLLKIITIILKKNVLFVWKILLIQ
jgi:hypothetical protein